MRFTALLLFVVVLVAPTRADDPPKVDRKTSVEVIGRADANVVEIRPRVTGYLDRVLVKEGEAVRKGEVLAEVDDRLSKTELDAAKAKLVVAQAEVKLAVANLARMKDIFAKGVGSKDDVTKAQAELEIAEAHVVAAKAAVTSAEIQLAFTKLTSPIDGRVGRFTMTAGNLLKADESVVVSVTAVDPIRVAFDLDERTLLAVRRAMSDNGGKPTVEVGLIDEAGYPHKATLEATPATVDPATGTARFRATLANPKELIVPGSVMRVRFTFQPGK